MLRFLVPRETPKPAPNRKNEDVYSNNWNIDRTCIFCEEQNDGFSEENLDMHYWRDCPVLTSCPLCKLVCEMVYPIAPRVLSLTM